MGKKSPKDNQKNPASRVQPLPHSNRKQQAANKISKKGPKKINPNYRRRMSTQQVQQANSRRINNILQMGQSEKVQLEKGQLEKGRLEKGTLSKGQQNQEHLLNLHGVLANQEQIECAFIIAEISEKYYHSYKTVLNRTAVIHKVASSQLSDAIIKHKAFGNMTVTDDGSGDESEGDKDDDEENAYSMLSILPGNDPLTIKLKGICKPVGSDAQIEAIIKSPNCGVLINERLVNVPPFLMQRSHQVLAKELKQSQSKKIPSHLVMVSRVEANLDAPSLEEMVFSRFEDYEFCKRSIKWWVSSEGAASTKGITSQLLFIVIAMKDYIEGSLNLEQYLEN